jgi:hypothetical protein
MSWQLRLDLGDPGWGRAVTRTVFALILVGTLGARAGAQEPGDGPHSENETAEHGEHKFHRHHVAVFFGATTAEVSMHGGQETVETESETGAAGAETESVTEASIGLDYEYRLSRLWGIGFLFDYVGGDARASVAGVPVYLHPVGGLKLLAAPGLEHHEGENEFLVRLGLGYEFEVGRWAITPGANVDFVDGEETYVYGLYIGRGF